MRDAIAEALIEEAEALFASGDIQIAAQAFASAMEAEPGKRWKYANNDTMLAMRALRQAINEHGGSDEACGREVRPAGAGGLRLHQTAADRLAVAAEF